MQPFAKEIDGEIHLSVAATLMMAADAAYGGDVTPTGAARGLALVHELLSAARAGGYTQSDIAETVLAQGTSQRAIEVAQTVCGFITPGAMQVAFKRAGFKLTS